MYATSKAAILHRKEAIGMANEDKRNRSGLFELGDTVITPAARSMAARLNLDPSVLIARHAEGDWGDLCDSDKVVNEQAVESGDSILSAYVVDGVKIYIVTEGNRSVTTVLLPEEY
jgi:hypothetical protein